MTIVWIACAFNFYLTGILVKYFPGDFNMNNFVMFSFDIAANCLAGWLCSVWKPKTFFTLFFSIAIIAGMSTLLFIDNDNPGWGMPLLVGLCRFGVAGAFLGVWVNHAKMFPTLFVATSIGISNLFARVFVVASPMIAEVTYPIPVIIFTFFNVIAGTSTFFLIDIEGENNKKFAAAGLQDKK